ncbi:MAG: DUF1573 domain-containing protein [Cyclobacteriaceae bacterium]
MCKWYGTYLLLLFALGSAAQDSTQIVFPKTTHNFGEIKENAGLISYDFQFENRGQSNLKIIDVESSCGCTAPSWTDSEVLPGEYGVVQVVLNPYNRPGKFDKTIIVKSNGIPSSYTLKIEGRILFQPSTLEEEFPYRLGQLRMKDRVLSLGNVYSNQVAKREFELYNSGDNILILSDEVYQPDYLKITFSSYTIKPRSRGRMLVQYDGKAKNDLGYFKDEVVIKSFEEEMAEKPLMVSATVLEYFDPENQNSASNRPELSAAKLEYDFGIVKQGQLVPMQFELRNSGEDTLHIRKVSASCECITLSMEHKDLEPGEKASLQVTFDTSSRVGNQEKFITVFSNDPQRPVQTLTFKGLIRKL